MTWLTAFIIQLKLFTAFLIYYVARNYINPDWGFQRKFHWGEWILIIVIWFGFITWLRHATRMPILGMWGWL